MVWLESDTLNVTMGWRHNGPSPRKGSQLSIALEGD